MRSLVVTTGQEQFIMNTWLPSLRSNAKYDGDVLIVDYYENESVTKLNNVDNLKHLTCFSEETVQSFLSQKNIIYRKVKNIYDCMASDRINAFYQCLEPLWNQYDVILITDGNDIEFFKPIKPLLEMAKNQLCAVKESLNNWAHTTWEPTYKFPSEYWKSVKDHTIINAGVIAGPPSSIKPLLKFMLENMKQYNSSFGSEQLSLNVWHYYKKNYVKDVGCSWNHLINDEDMKENFQIKFRVNACCSDILSYIPLRILLSIKKRSGCYISTWKHREMDIAILHEHEKIKKIIFETTPYFTGDSIFLDGKEHEAVLSLEFTNLPKGDIKGDIKMHSEIHSVVGYPELG